MAAMRAGWMNKSFRVWIVSPVWIMSIVLGFGATVAAGAGAIERPAGGTREVYAFTVLRDGAPIGEHRVVLTRDGDTTEARIDVLLEVGFGPIVLYRYRHREREIWRAGKFVSLQSTTDDDGENWSVDVEARAGGAAVRVNEDAPVLVPSLVPTTYWNRATVEQSFLLGTQEGNSLAVNTVEAGEQTILAGGREIEATRYEMRGELNLDLWYDRADRWVKMVFDYKDSRFDYILQPPENIETWTANAAIPGSEKNSVPPPQQTFVSPYSR